MAFHRSSFFRAGVTLLTLVGSAALLSACSEATSNNASSPASSAPVSPVAKTSVAAELRVYKSPTCGCCKDWVEHVEQRGFSAAVRHPNDLNGLKRELGIGPQYQSCHTAVSEQGYLFEGHVPAKLVARFLDNPPAGALGLTAPGMPMGSPGMESGSRFTPYQVLLLKKDGTHQVYATIDRQEQQY